MSDEDEEYASEEGEDTSSEDEVVIEESSEDVVEVEVKAKFEYKVLSPEMIKKSQLEEINAVMNLMEIPSTTSRQLLELFKWNRHKLVETYFEGSDQLFKKAGILNPNALKKVVVPSVQMECPVCYDDIEPGGMVGLNCQHWACKDCYQEYIRSQLSQGKSAQIVCQGEGCKLLIDEVFVYDVLTDEDLTTRYTKMVAETFVRNNVHVKWCANPSGCDHAVQVVLSKAAPVTCQCGFTFCFACEDEVHQPAQCGMNREWKKKLMGDAETLSFLALYTKECPKCACTINKDEGCQYMVCTQCSHHFCWICMGNFDHQKHTCNSFQPQDGVEDTRHELNKFNFYHERYLNHKRSLELEGKLKGKIEKLMRTMEEEQNVSWMHVEYIRKANEQLAAARAILMNTYIYGYYIPEGTNRELFEYLQSELEDTTNRLSQILEGKQKEYENRPLVIDLTRNVATRLENLTVALEEGDITGGAGSKDRVFSGPDNSYSGWIYEG